MTRGGSELVSAARSGDPAAWRELYTAHNPRLTAWLRSLPSADAAASAEDVASEAWLTAASKLDQFPGTDDEFVRWLFTIARNHAANTRRTAVRRRTDPVDDTLIDRGGVIATDAIAAVDGMDVTRRLLSQLSPREAEVVACIDVVGLDVKATAQALGMNPTAVRVARHRALGRLRKIMDGPDAAAEPSTVPTSM